MFDDAGCIVGGNRSSLANLARSWESRATAVWYTDARFIATFAFREVNIAMQTMDQVRSYRILLREEPEGGYTVSVPTLPGCITYGENIADAIAMAREAIDLFIESLVAHGEDIPSEEGTLEYTITVPVYA
jgi:antitoxin HicB